ncbi:MAG: hypothetical protein R2798_12315 [Chitinophagales bacterium]|nr:hypothetical protein [Bacteroidota bacterium]MCB9043035.1 hypothetical protein [Chitinophagales bacterium]
MKNWRYFLLFCVSSCFIILSTSNIWAQCPMCRAAAESNLKEGGTFALGLNAGILYLAAVPYLLVGTLGFIWFRRYKKAQEGSN